MTTKILLMGNPNVGKSAIFSRLTGVNVIASNYPGTTVEFTKGYMKTGEDRIEIIDVPGTYSLEPTSRAEEIAVEMLKTGNLIINVVDSTNLERNLSLTLGLLNKNMPMIVVLNFWDETSHKGISIDVGKLEQKIGVPVIPVCGITGEGIKELVNRLGEAKRGLSLYHKEEEKWSKIGAIVKTVQILTHKHHTFFERLSEFSVHPLTGLPIALIIMYLSFKIVRFIGEGLIGYILEPLFEKFWLPVVTRISQAAGADGFIHDILIGNLIEGKIDFVQSFGLFTTGIYVPLAMVLPYVVAFYFVLGILEDSGYLPRLAVMVDRIMHLVGLHGLSIIPILLGLGCNVPGILAARIMETKREKLIISILLVISVPCAAKTAMIMGLVGKYGAKGLFPIFGTLFGVFILLGILLNKILKGESPEIFLEIPPYRMPYTAALLKKLFMRIKLFLKEAVPFVLLGVVIVNLLYALKIIYFFDKYTGPVLIKLFGLPPEAITALLIGFLRKDVAVGMLAPLKLSLKQLIISSVVLSMYFPCAAAFTVLLKEFGLKDMLKAIFIMVILTIVIGILLNIVF